MLDVGIDRLLDDMPGAVSGALGSFDGFLDGLGGAIGLVGDLPAIPTEVAELPGVSHLLDAIADNPVLDAIMDLLGDFDSDEDAVEPPQSASFDMMLAGFKSAAESAPEDAGQRERNVGDHTGSLVSSLGTSATPITITGRADVRRNTRSYQADSRWNNASTKRATRPRCRRLS